MVTVIIPALNEEKTIRQVIRQAKRNELVNEIIVVDDMSTDDTIAEARKDTSINNLSSLVVLAEFGDDGTTKSILLTGDALGNYIVDSLKEAGKLSNGTIDVVSAAPTKF